MLILFVGPALVPVISRCNNRIPSIKDSYILRGFNVRTSLCSGYVEFIKENV